MRRALLVMPLSSILACSSPSAPPAETPASGGVRRVDRTPPPLPDADEGADGSAAAPAQAAPEQLAADCDAPKIDLRDIFNVGVCQVEGKGDRIPATISRSIEPAVIETRAGKPARGAIRLENTGSEPADVLLSMPCDLEHQIGTWIENPANGKAVDSDRPDCATPSTSGCLATIHQIRLPPGGTARFPFEASTEVRAWDESCQAPRRTGAVPRGRYKLRVRALFLGATLDADLVVR